MIIESIITALIAAFFIGFKDGKLNLKRTISIYGITALFGTIAIYAYMYLVTPSFVGILGGYYRVAAIPILIISILYIIIAANESNSKEIGIQILKIVAVSGIAVYLSFTPILHNQQLHDIPEVTINNNLSEDSNFAPIDAQNMRIVDQSMAYYLGNKVIGSSDQNIGSQFQVTQDDFTIQNVNGRLFWVAPLEFRGIWKWQSLKTSPGFIMVDAEDPTKPAKLYTGYKMQYMTSSYLWDNVIRHLYTNGYENVRLQDINFEVTDSLQPRWVVSLTSPSVLNSGDIVKGVAVIDPETGDITKYQVGEVPDWVDRVVPEETAKDYLSWYGSYVHGWLNTVTSERDVNVITSDEIYFIHGNDGKAYWFTGMTSPSSSDQSLTWLALMNSKDGKITLYKMSGWNEQAVTNAVDAAVSNFQNYKGCQPIPYECSGRLAYVVPVAASTDTGYVYQEVGIVDAITGHVSLGETKAKAFEEYRRYLNQNGFNFAVSSSSVQKDISGIVGRISGIVSSNDLDYRLINLNTSDVIFEVSISQYPEAALTNVGDEVFMSYEDTNDTVITVDTFDNIGINSRVSEEQQNYTEARDNQTGYETNNWEKQQELQKEIEKLRNE